MERNPSRVGIAILSEACPRLTLRTAGPGSLSQARYLFARFVFSTTELALWRRSTPTERDADVRPHSPTMLRGLYHGRSPGPAIGVAPF
jgi:hypothetical protein